MVLSARHKSGALTFKPKVFREQINGIEESICDIVTLRHPGKWVSFAPLFVTTVHLCFALHFSNG